MHPNTTFSWGPATGAGLAGALSRTLQGRQPAGDTLGRLADLARRVLPEDAEVSITVLQHGREGTVASTGALARYLDECQYALSRSPCVDAAVSGRTVAAARGPTSAYPGLTRVLERQQVNHVLAVGLPFGSFGALNVYGRSPLPFDAGIQQLAGAAAGCIALFLANLALQEDAEELATRTRQVAESHALVDQAQGVILACEGCSPETAFELLTRVAQQQDGTLREAAAGLLRRARSDWRLP